VHNHRRCRRQAAHQVDRVHEQRQHTFEVVVRQVVDVDSFELLQGPLDLAGQEQQLTCPDAPPQQVGGVAGGREQHGLLGELCRGRGCSPSVRRRRCGVERCGYLTVRARTGCQRQEVGRSLRVVHQCGKPPVQCVPLPGRQPLDHRGTNKRMCDGHPPFRFLQHTGDDGRVQCRNRVSHPSVQRIQCLRHVDATRGGDDGKRGRGVRAERSGEPPTQ